jgi:F0F1-type ATP synthase assembly protein I
VVQRLRGGLRVQSLISVALAVILLAVSPVAATSALFGSLAVYLPGLMFTVLTVRKLGGDTGAFLRTATLAEFGKLLLTGLLCALVFVFVKPLAPGYFFLGMIVTLVVGWAMLMRAFTPPKIGH